MAGIRDILELPPAVGDFLVLGQRVGDQREGPQLLAEHRAQRLRRLAAHLAVAVLQLVERELERQLLAIDDEAQRGDGLVEEAVPGGCARHRLLVEQRLDPVVELMRLVLSEIVDPGLPVREGRFSSDLRQQARLDPVQLQFEEQQFGDRGVQLVLRVAVELGALRIGRVAGIDQTGIGADPAEQVAQALIALHCGCQCRAAVWRCGEFRELAAIAASQRLRIEKTPLQIALELRRFDPGIKMGQVPFREIAGRIRRLCRPRLRGGTQDGLMKSHSLDTFAH